MMPTLQSFAIKLGIAALILAALLGWHLWEVSKSYASGQLNERLVWQERQAREQQKRDDERRQAQTTIDQIERDYWAKQAGDAVKISELEKALETDTADARAACTVAISRGVSGALNAIGR